MNCLFFLQEVQQQKTVLSPGVQMSALHISPGMINDIQD